MRWSALFDDMEAQLAAAELASGEAEIADRVRHEQASIQLLDRLRGQIGLLLRVRVSGGTLFTGELTHVGREWLILSDSTSEVVVPLAAVQTVEGLSRNVGRSTSPIEQRLGLGSAFRSLARDRSPVVVYLIDRDARVEGTIDRVGHDFVEVAAVLPGEQRRTASVTGVYAIPFAAIAGVSSR